MERFFTKLFDMIAEVSVNFGTKLIGAMLLLVVGFKLVNFAARKIRKSLHKNKKIDESAESFIFSYLTFILKAIIILSAVNILGVPMSSMIAVIGSAGLAIGLSLQGSLSNFAGGLMIMLFRPFNVGDYIISSGAEGTVQSISILYTVLLTGDNKRVVVPNATISNDIITNCSAEDTRRVDCEFTVSYSADIDKVKGMLTSIMENHPLVLSAPDAPFARVGAHGDSSVVLKTRCWCKSEDYWTVYFDLTEEVKRRFDAEGIEIPFPQMDVHVKND